MITVITIILLTVGLSGCIDNSSNIVNKNNNNNVSEQDKFIGKWETEESINNPNILQTYEFYNNGTLLSIYLVYSPSETHEGLADYQLENKKICMQAQAHGAITDGDAYCYNYKFYDDDTRMVLDADELPTVTLIKIQ